MGACSLLPRVIGQGRASELLYTGRSLGGEEGVACAGRLAARTDPKLSAAAVATLARWPDASALPALAGLAQSAGAPSAREAIQSSSARIFRCRLTVLCGSCSAVASSPTVSSWRSNAESSRHLVASASSTIWS